MLVSSIDGDDKAMEREVVVVVWKKVQDAPGGRVE